MRMPFGRFQGRPLACLPTAYLWWLLTLDDLEPALRDTIQQVLEGRTASPGQLVLPLEREAPAGWHG